MLNHKQVGFYNRVLQVYIYDLLKFSKHFHCLIVIYIYIYIFLHHMIFYIHIIYMHLSFVCYIYFHMLANKRYVLASRTICRTDATAPTMDNTEEATAINVLPQKTRPRFEGLKVTL
jgi:hypothetical protein